jgi:hypothetical protein
MDLAADRQTYRGGQFQLTETGRSLQSNMAFPWTYHVRPLGEGEGGAIFVKPYLATSPSPTGIDRPGAVMAHASAVDSRASRPGAVAFVRPTLVRTSMIVPFFAFTTKYLNANLSLKALGLDSSRSSSTLKLTSANQRGPRTLTGPRAAANLWRRLERHSCLLGLGHLPKGAQRLMSATSA